MEGRYARLVPLRASEHSPQIFAANALDDSIWDYMPYGPFADEAAYHDWVQSVENGDQTVYLAIFDKEQGHWAGVASYLRIDQVMGSIEVGNINFSAPLKRTRAATETMYLMMKWAFESGYRRYEWKCNAGNLPSRSAAQRLGLSFEGVFRQHMIIKGRNRDTAWLATIDAEWPALEQAFETWLDPSNFDASGRQKIALRDLTAPVLVSIDPTLG